MLKISFLARILQRNLPLGTSDPFVLIQLRSFNLVTMAIDSFWSVRKKDYQVPLKVIDEPNEPTIDFPLVIETQKGHSKEEIINQVAKLAAQDTDKDVQSPLRKLLDSNGGAIHMKGLNLKTADDFSDFLDGLAGKGPHAWVPHEHVGMEVLRRPQARNVLTTNE